MEGGGTVSQRDITERLRMTPVIVVADHDGRWVRQTITLNEEARAMMLEAASTIERLRREAQAWRGDFDIPPRT